MKDSVRKKSAKNVILSLSSQVITMALGLILPRLLITGFGSEVNGFFSTVTQLYTYLEVLRAGVGMAAIQALYGPIVRNDKEQISKIISTSRRYFQKLGIIYLVCTMCLSIGLVIYENNSLSNVEIFLIVFMQGISGWISFSLINWFVDLLRAEGKNYIFIFIQTVGSITIKLLEILLIYTTRNPVLVKSTTLFIMIIEYSAFSIYRNKNYKDYNFKDTVDYSLLKNRGSYLVFHITSLICTNTDIVVLSFFCGYQVSSVYSVYYMIVAGVNAIINAVYSSTSFLLGHSYQRGLEHFKNTHDAYYLVYTTLTTSLFAVCYILMLPFIRLYTRGVTDTNYIYEYLPVLFCIIQILTCSKNVGDITVNVGGYARNVVWRAALEAGLNIVISIILVQFIGIYGVLIGTIVALSYRLIDVMWFSNKMVLKRGPFKNLRILFTNIILFVVVAFLNTKFNIEINGYFDFFRYALVISPIVVVSFFGIMLILNRKESKFILEQIKNRKS